MPVDIAYNIKCDMCADVKVDGPYDLGIDGGLHLAPIPWVQLGDWVIVDYKVICPRHKIQIFKGYGHGRKKMKAVFISQTCHESRHSICSNPSCTCHCHIKTKPRDSL